jgi:hypothetical protein
MEKIVLKSDPDILRRIRILLNSGYREINKKYYLLLAVGTLLVDGNIRILTNNYVSGSGRSKHFRIWRRNIGVLDSQASYIFFLDNAIDLIVFILP